MAFSLSNGVDSQAAIAATLQDLPFDGVFLELSVSSLSLPCLWFSALPEVLNPVQLPVPFVRSGPWVYRLLASVSFAPRSLFFFGLSES